MLGLHDYRTKSRSVRVVNSLVVDRHAKVSGRAERLHRRIHFFESAPDRFLALIDAEEHLRSGPGYGLVQSSVLPMARQTAQNLSFMPAFIGKMEDAAALHSIARSYFAYERRPFRRQRVC